MALMNFKALQDAVVDWMDRPQLADKTIDDGTGQISPVAVFAGQVEATVNRRLRTEDMSTILFTRTCDDQEMILLPDNVLGLRLVTKNGVDVEYLTPEQFARVSTVGAAAGSTQVCEVYFTRVANQLLFYPTLTNKDAVNVVGYVAIDPLVNDADSNWLLRKFSDVYLYGCLEHACGYVYDDVNEAQWKAKFDEAMVDLAATDAEDKYSGSSLRVRSY